MLIQTRICSICIFNVKIEVKSIPLCKMTGKIPVLLVIAREFQEPKPARKMCNSSLFHFFLVNVKMVNKPFIFERSFQLMLKTNIYQKLRQIYLSYLDKNQASCLLKKTVFFS